MKKHLRIGFILGVWLVSLCSAAIVAGEEARQDGPAGPPPLRAEEYPLGDQPLDPITFQRFFRQYPEPVRKALPTSYDARSEGIVSVAKNQGSCGSCWAFASAGAMESHIKRTYPAALLYDLSEQQQVSCNTSMAACSGGSSTAVLFWQSQGPNLEADYPYASGGGAVPACSAGHAELNYRVSGFYTTSGTDNFKASLADKGPSYWRYAVHADFQSYWNGSETKAYVNTTANFQGGHAVLLIGWDDDKDVVGGGKGAFLCKNSWGATGGPNGDGTFWIAYAGHANDLGFAMCNFDVGQSTLTLTSPNGGEAWAGGESHDITWTSSGNVGDVKIEYSTDGGTGWATVAGSTADDGTHAWSVPGTPSSSCLVRVSKAAGGDPADASNGMFTISNPVVPAIAVTAPAAGALWERGKAYAITWTKQGALNANVKIMLYKGTSTLVKTLISTTPNDGQYDWLVPAAQALGSTYFIRVKTVDNLVTGDSDKFAVIVPTITVTAPAAGTVWVKEAVKAITWTKQGTQDANVKVQLYKGTIKKLDIALSAPNSGSYDWAVPSTLANGLYTIQVTTLDGKVKGKSAAFSIATGVIRVTAPAAGAKLIRGTERAITWSSEGTVNANVRIELYKGTTRVLTIAASVPTAAGTYAWTVPAAQALAATYSIKVTALDNLVSGKTGNLAVVAGILTVTAPTTGTVWQRGLPHVITWTKEGAAINANVKIQLFKGTTLVSTIAATTPNDESYEWTIPAGQVVASTYKIRITTVDNLVKADSAAFAISAGSGLALTAPNEGEALQAAAPAVIRWSEDPDVLEVKLEFSRDNGGTYASIVDRTEDTGAYEWQVPVNFTRNGLVRVSDANGRPWREEHQLVCTFRFLYGGAEDEPGARIWFGAADPKAPSYEFARIDIGARAVGFGGLAKAVDLLAGSWHELKVRLDLRRDTAAIYMDDQLLFEHAALGTTRERYFEPGLAIAAGSAQAGELRLDDLAIAIARLDELGEERESFSVLKDDFERYDARSNPLASCWRLPAAAAAGSAAEIDAGDPRNKALRLATEAGATLRLRLPFALPDHVPFDVSDKNVAIGNQ